MNADQPVTMNQLREYLVEFRVEFRAELRGDIAQAMALVVDALAPRFDAIDARFGAIDARFGAIDDAFARQTDELRQEIARSALANAEQNRRDIGVFDDKYRDLPGRVAVLERELDGHRADPRLHPHLKRDD